METSVQGSIKQVLDKQQCDKIKQRIKKLLIQIDHDKKGFVKAEVFKSILDLHKVVFGQTSMQRLVRSCSVPG